jgi:hypothetical protein
MKQVPCFIKVQGGRYPEGHVSDAGFSLVEVLLAISLLMMISVGIVSVVAYAQDVRSSAEERPYAVILAQEGLEVVRGLRNVVVSEVPDGTYAIERSDAVWMLVEGSEVIDGIYSREVEISSVEGAVKRVDATVSWTGRYGGDKSVVLSTLIADWQSAVGGPWLFPVLRSSLDLPGNENGIKVVIDGTEAYVIQDRGTESLIAIDISDSLSPSILGIANILGGPRGLAVSGDLLFAASTQRDAEFQMFDISSPSAMSLVYRHDPTHRQPGLSVLADGGYVYLGRERGKEQEFWVYDVSDPEGVLVHGVLDMEGSIEDSVRYGDYLVVASDDRNQEVKVIDISDPSGPFVAGGYDLPGKSAALACDISGNHLIVGMDTGAVYLLDVSDIADISIVGEYEAGRAVRDISLDRESGIAFIGGDENKAELQILDISDPAAISQIGVYDAPADINGVWYDEASGLLYAVGDSNDQELMIFSPQ